MFRGIIFTLIAGIAFGFSPVISTLVYNNGGDPMTLVFLRYAYMIPVSLSIVLFKKKELRLPAEQMLKLVFVAVGCSLVSSLTLYMSYQWIDPGVSTAIHFMYPVILVVLSLIIFKDKIDKKTIIALAFSICGTLSIVEFGQSGSILGVVFAIVSSFAYSMYLLLNEKWRLAELDSMVFLFYVSVFCTLTMLVMMPLGFKINLNQPIENHLVMIVVALLTSCVGLLFMKEGVRILGSRIASVISMSEPISALVFSALLLHSEVTISKVIGAVFIITAILILLYKPKRKRVKVSDTTHEKMTINELNESKI